MSESAQGESEQLANEGWKVVSIFLSCLLVFLAGVKYSAI